eukprot:186094-Chlamydomonas_euryale.AAC.2
MGRKPANPRPCPQTRTHRAAVRRGPPTPYPPSSHAHRQPRAQERCSEWAATGECVHNRDFMEDTCGLSCDVCTTDEGIEGLAPANHDLPKVCRSVDVWICEGPGTDEGIEGLAPANRDLPKVCGSVEE